MADVNVISINPGKKTLGALNIDVIEKVARSCRPAGHAIRIPKTKTVCNFIFGINKAVTSAWSSKLWICRSIISALFIAEGIISVMAGVSGTDLHLAIFNIIAGTLIFPGLFTRITAISGFILYLAMGAASIPGLGLSFPVPAHEGLDFGALAQSSAFLFLAITGPGRYSIDQLLRRSIFLSAKRRAIKRARNAAARRLSYKAWNSGLSEI